MRFPLELIAAVLCMNVIGDSLAGSSGVKYPALQFGPGLKLLTWAAYFLLVWLMNEWVTRRAEWRTRFGHCPAGTGNGKHPLEIHAFHILIAQSISVALYAALLWILQWPLFTRNWWHWLGIVQKPTDSLDLSNSQVAAMFLNLAPFLIGMLLSWLPRRRLVSGLRRRPIPLLKYLAFEIRMTWLPMVAMVLITVLYDLCALLPKDVMPWKDDVGVQAALSLCMLAGLALIGLPLLMVSLWTCRPLPDGELKERLLALLSRSGVKVRSIYVWGSRESGLLNACVLGPWSTFRYVLISPALVDELSLEETEAVLAHELGHARYGHLTLLFVMLLCMSALIDPVTHILPEAWRSSPLIQVAVMLGFVGLYVWGFFGAVMRQCEKEADLASAELVGSPLPLITALEKLALISGHSRNVYTWHHGSIADRVASVLRLSADPDGSAKIHAQIRRVRLLYGLMTVLALGVQFLWLR
jgi:Zn-dependent protease with chaperone function